MPNRPNILLVTSDQQRGDCFGFEGRRIRTPHFDRMAQGGARFSLCHTPNPVCQPARASMLTGMLPLTHGVCDNGIDLDPKIGKDGFAGRLGRSGYQTAFIGKAHFSTKGTFQPTGTPECQTGSTGYGEDWYGPYMGFKHVELMTLGHWYKFRTLLRPPHGQHFERWFFSRPGGEDAYRLWTEGEEVASQTWHSKLPVALHSSTWTADRTINYLSRHDRKEGPFCMWVSFPDPHHSFDCPEPWSRLHPVDGVDLPTNRVKDLDRRPWWHRASLESTPKLSNPELLQFRSKGSRVPDQTDRQLAEMTANYYGMISLIDHSFGRIVTALEDLGLAEDTVVIYTSDHGDLLGDHGLYLKGPTPYEGLLRVGLIVKGPGVPGGSVIEDPVSTLDLAATFYDYGGAKTPAGIQSRSLRPLVEKTGETREAAYSEWNLNASRCGVPLELRTVRTRTHKLTVDLNSGAGELYDLENDPQEMDNLFDDPGRTAVRKELEGLIRDRPGEIRETFAEPVGMA